MSSSEKVKTNVLDCPGNQGYLEKGFLDISAGTRQILTSLRICDHKQNISYKNSIALP